MEYDRCEGMMNIIIFGGAGFLGTNLVLNLAKNSENKIVVVDKDEAALRNINHFCLKNVSTLKQRFNEKIKFDEILLQQDIVYHLVSTTVPTTANQHIAQELEANIIATVNLLEACVQCNIKKLVFLSSGGTVYGKSAKCPIKEDSVTYPINSYGLQKVTIEKLIYLYWHMHGLDYRIIRLANPYGPYQKPNGILGAVTTFTYKALRDEELIVYGDGSIVRDFIYIDDAIKAIVNITWGESEWKLFNIGCGYGTSINELLKIIANVLNRKLTITYKSERTIDVPRNILDISRYEQSYGELNPITLELGIIKLTDFISKTME